MKLEKLIVSVDDSHYKDYWPLIAKVAKKVLKVTPVLIKICDEDSDFYFDNHGLVKKIKAIENYTTQLQSLFARMYATKWFPEEVCIISDIDMMVLSEEYFSKQIENFSDDSFVIYSSDAYQREDFHQGNFALCYTASKGKHFDEILELEGSFEEFLNNVTKTVGISWFSDESYLTKKVKEKENNYEIKKLKRGFSSDFYCPNRIEKWNLPIKYTDAEMIGNSKREGPYKIDKLEREEYFDCHCIRPYGWFYRELQDIANIIFKKQNLIRTIPDWDYSLINDRCFVDDDPIVDLGCLGWDWSKLFIGKKRVVGVDPFEREIPFAEIFKGVIGTFDGEIRMVNTGIGSNIYNQSGGEIVKVKTWKNFCKEFNIDKVSILKVNIEGAEYDLLKSFDDNDFDKIDQIAISFHDWMVPEWRNKTEESLELLKKNHFEISKINYDWGWYLAVKKKKNYLLKTEEKKDLILVTSHCNTNEKLEVLRNLVKQISNHKSKFDLMVVSHTTIPQDIAENTEYCFYDKKNELLYDWDMRCKPWFSPDGGKPIMSMYTGFHNTHLAIWRMIILGNSLAKSLGYEKVHHLEYDCHIENFDELYQNSKLLEYHDAITYNKSEANVTDILFGTYQAYRLDTLCSELLILDEYKLKQKIKIADDKSPEKMLLEALHDGKNSLIKEKNLLDREGNVFGLSHHNLNIEHSAWCLPYFNRDNEKLSFIVWNMEGKRDIDVTVIYNDEKVLKFNEVKPGFWSLIDIDDFKNAKKLITILNGKIRNTFDFTNDPEAFKQSSFR